MTFARFEELVKAVYTEAELFRHGEFAGSKINVTIIFKPNGKCYSYNGTYCDVLNRLGIKAIYKHDYDNIVSTLERYKRDNGKKCLFFDTINDYSREIEEYTNRLNDVKQNYVIV